MVWTSSPLTLIHVLPVQDGAQFLEGLDHRMHVARPERVERVRGANVDEAGLAAGQVAPVAILCFGVLGGGGGEWLERGGS